MAFEDVGEGFGGSCLARSLGVFGHGL
jgi:hypothetical protein